MVAAVLGFMQMRGSPNVDLEEKGNEIKLSLGSESDSGHLERWLTDISDISATEYFMILFETPHPPGYKMSVVNKTCDQKYVYLEKKHFFRSELYFISDVCD